MENLLTWKCYARHLTVESKDRERVKRHYLILIYLIGAPSKEKAEELFLKGLPTDKKFFVNIEAVADCWTTKEGMLSKSEIKYTVTED